MNTKVLNNRFRTLLCVLGISCVVMGAWFPVSASAQTIAESLVVEPAEQAWKAPDLTNLPSTWWTQLNTGSPEEINQHFAAFLAAMDQRSSGLVDNEQVTAKNGIAHLKTSFELLALARQGPGDMNMDPPLAKTSYFLEDVLNLRQHGRDLELQASQLQLQLDQTNTQISFLQQRRDKLIADYNATNPESPARILSGIKRITARVEYELAKVRVLNFEERLKEISKQSNLVSEQQKFARQHLVVQEDAIVLLEASIEQAQERVAETSSTVAALQMQLLDVLSADQIKPSLEVLRKQQLIRASADAELAKLEQILLNEKYNWHRLKANLMDDGFDLKAVMENTRRVTSDSLKQAEVWSSIARATLSAPYSDSSLNTVKNFELAQSNARDTLLLVNRISSTSEDILIIEDILADEVLSNGNGIGNTQTRLMIFFFNSWETLVALADYHLFDIGETAVTPAGLVKMLMILGLAIGISWLIRYLLARGIRKRRTAQSPAFYTLGRILHYIIILAGSFAALGSIGIDFTSFALIAGALSVGIGFGLQAIVSNFVSGLILLFEGTLRVGDFIEMEGDLRGVVKEINTRATVINTNDAVDLVVPNSQLVTTQLTNWTLRESYGRLRVSFGVAYGSDKELVKELANEAVGKVDFALTHMPGLEPQVRLSNFGDSALEFTVLFWVSRQGVRRPGRTRAAFLWELETLLREHGVEIPFPQRDVHMKSDSRNDPVLVQGDMPSPEGNKPG